MANLYPSSTSYPSPSVFPGEGPDPKAPPEAVTDDFNREDENPLSQNGKWFGTSIPQLKLVGTEARNSQEGPTFVFATSLYRKQFFDSYAFVTVTNAPTQLTGFYIRSDSATANGYLVYFTGGNVRMYTTTAGVQTLVEEAPRTVATGGTLGVAAQGEVISAWYKPPGGSWELVAYFTDPTYTSGYLGLTTNSPNTRYENFGAGGVEPAPPAQLPKAAAGIDFARYAIASPPSGWVDPITRPDKFFVTQWWHTAEIAAARALGSKILIYLNLTRAREPSAEGHQNSGLTLKEAKALGAVSGEFDEDAGGWVCKPGTPGYAELWAEKAIARAKEVGAEGVFLDDMNHHDNTGGELTDTQWREQMQHCNEVVGAALAKAGILSIANMAGATGQRNIETGGWVEAQFAFYDGGLEEFTVTFPNEALQSRSRIEESCSIMHNSQLAENDKYYIACTNSNKDEVIRFALTCCLLNTAGKILFFATPGPPGGGGPQSPDYRYEKWTQIHDEARSLGLPVSEAALTDEGWERRFQHGTILVDFATNTGTIKLIAPTRGLRVGSEPVDDTLFYELRGVGGLRHRFSGLEPDAGNIAQRGKISDAAPGGYRTGSYDLLRDPRRDWPDLSLVDELVIYGRTKPLGRHAFEGMVSQIPSSLGDGYGISVSAVGHQELLNENEAWKALYVKLGFDGFGEAPLVRRELLAAAGVSQGKIALGVGKDGLAWDPPAEALAANETTEAHYAAPAGIGIKAVGYRGKRKGDWSKFEAAKVFGDDTEDLKEGAEAASLSLDGAPHTATFARAWRYVMLRALVAEAAPIPPGTQQSYDRLALYGDTGVPLREIAGELPGVYFHDVLADILSTGAPDLKYTVGPEGTIVSNTSFVMADFAPTDPGKPRDAIEKGNAYYLNNYAVWDDMTFWWHPWEPDRLTWKASIAGGAHWSPVGRQAFSLLNGLVVAYTDNAGIQRTAGPPGSGCDYESPSLAVSDPRNPYTRRGRRRWGRLDVGFPIAFPTLAFQMGAVVLVESRMPQRGGTLVVRPRGPGHIPSISHPTMGPLPLWALRSGEFVKLMDWPEPEPFRIVEKDYDIESKTLTVQLDSGAARLSAILERTGSRLTFV